MDGLAGRARPGVWAWVCLTRGAAHYLTHFAMQTDPICLWRDEKYSSKSTSDDFHKSASGLNVSSVELKHKW
jgi:hypothetical protein